MGKLLGTYHGHVENQGFLLIFPLNQYQRPTEALSLHSYVMAQLEAIGARRRFLFKISVGGFFLFGFTWFYSPIYLG